MSGNCGEVEMSISSKIKVPLIHHVIVLFGSVCYLHAGHFTIDKNNFEFISHRIVNFNEKCLN